MDVGRLLFHSLLIISIAFIQTCVFLVILYFLERFGIFVIQVVAFNSELIYPYELGGFFFAMLLIGEIIADLIRIKIKKYYKPPK